MPEQPIDAVVAWVDGADPAHRDKLEHFSTRYERKHDSSCISTRFASLGEIRYCVASICRFAPWVRHIFILTDSQNPCLGDFIDRNFPDGHPEISIVDHRDIYRGYEQYLPVFSSRSFETVLWRIPGLSERFIYFNDDMILRRPCRVGDFFRDDRLVCYAHRFSIPLLSVIGVFRFLFYDHKYGFKDTISKGARLAGERRWFQYIGHLPHPVFKSVMEDYFQTHPDVMENNMKCRFRSRGQFNPQSLSYHLNIRNGRCEVLPREGVDVCMRPNDDPEYVPLKIAECKANPGALAICVNSLDRAPESCQHMMLDYLASLTGVTF